MDAEELKTKTGDELKKLLVDLKKKQFNLRFQRSQGQLADTAQVRNVRRDIARVKTFLGFNGRTGGVPSPKKKAPKTEKAASAEAKPAAKKAAKKPAKKTGKKDAA